MTGVKNPLKISGFFYSGGERGIRITAAALFHAIFTEMLEKTVISLSCAASYT